MEKLMCDRCGRTYTDRASIESAKREAAQWAELVREDDYEPRGLCPCPIFPCEGELILVDDLFSARWLSVERG